VFPVRRMMKPAFGHGFVVELIKMAIEVILEAIGVPAVHKYHWENYMLSIIDEKSTILIHICMERQEDLDRKGRQGGGGKD
jgi:hypothetical protein